MGVSPSKMNIFISLANYLLGVFVTLYALALIDSNEKRIAWYEVIMHLMVGITIIPAVLLPVYWWGIEAEAHFRDKKNKKWKSQ